MVQRHYLLEYPPTYGLDLTRKMPEFGHSFSSRLEKDNCIKNVYIVLSCLIK